MTAFMRASRRVDASRLRIRVDVSSHPCDPRRMPGGVLEGDDLVFWQTFLRWSQGIHSAVNRAVSEAANLSVSEFEVLIRLWSDPDRTVSQHDLSTELGWSPSRASHLLRRL